MSNGRQRAERLGRRAEWRAELALRLKGYRVLARRYRTPFGEIDLIVRRGDLVLFVEVKARRTLLDAMEAVTATTERRIASASDRFMTTLPDHARLSYRYDLVAVLPWRWPVHVKGAF